MKKTFCILCALCFMICVFGGCADNSIVLSETSSEALSENEIKAEEYNFSQSESDMFSERDYETDYDESDSTVIELRGDTIAVSTNNVNVSGTVATILKEGTYILSGSLENGMIIVDADDASKVQIVLDNAYINSETSAALYILKADKVFITLADGSANSLGNAGSFTAIDNNNIDGAIFSKADITFNGSGELIVDSPEGHGIVGKDDVVFTGGSYIINSAYHGIDANDSVRIDSDTSFTISSGKDGIHCENKDDATRGYVYIANADMVISAQGDGISSGYFIQIEDGSFDIIAGGGSVNGDKTSSDNYGGYMGGPPKGDIQENESSEEESGTSMKGIKSANSIMIKDGDFLIDSADDGVHSDMSVIINGGSFDIATGDDGIHGEDVITIENGSINIKESYEGIEALEIYIKGGSISVVSADDGINAAGGVDNSGFQGGRDGMYGNHGNGGPGNGGSAPVNGGPGNGGSAPVNGGPGNGEMNSASDGIINISGGDIFINGGGDGLDANGSILISGGNIVVAGPTQGDTSVLDYDVSATISGGTFIGTGASGMAQSITSSGQGVIAVVTDDQPSGTKTTVTNENGEEIVSYIPELSYTFIVISSPDIVVGAEYTVTVGELSGVFQAY